MEIRIGVLIVVFFLVLAWALPAQASPVAQASPTDGVVITVTDEPCAFTDIVDLPHRATWLERGKTFEGCWAPGPAGLVVMYFNDKSIALAPMRLFQPLRSM